MLETKSIRQYARFSKNPHLSDSDSKTKRLLLISDTHITNDIDPYYNSQMFRKGMEEIKKIKNVDYFIHLGDLTQEGTYLQYELALDLIQSINKENFYIIPGNHDARNEGYLLFEDFFGSRTFEIEDEIFYMLGIDSSLPDQNFGRIGNRAITNSRKKFLEHQDKIKILTFHHQLIPIPMTGRERSAIIDGGDALAMTLETDVNLVLNGHRHISNVYSCTDGEGELVIFNCGTLSCNQTRYRELFSYTILDLSENTAMFTTKKLLDGEQIERGRFIKYPSHSARLNMGVPVIARIVQIAHTKFSEHNFNESIYERAVEQINSLNCDLVIHNGAITDHNEIEEYKMAKEKLKKIRHPLMIIPGRHDVKDLGWELFPLMMGPMDPVFENDKLKVLGINSNDRNMSNGNVGRKAVKDTANYFKQHSYGKINIVALYHSLVPHPKSKFDDILSDSGNVLKKLTEPENNIHLILMGRDKTGFSLQIEDTVLASCGPVSANNYINLKKNTYNIITCYENGTVSVEEVQVETNNKTLIGHFWINLKLKSAENIA